jgi:galactokinase
MNLDFVKEKFKELFAAAPEGLFFAPGRANLIGEHIDYNGGHVLPCALTFGTYLAASKRNDGRINFYSLNFEEAGLIRADINQISKTNNWTDYPKGVIAELVKAGAKIDCGFDAVYYGNIPNGAGLSSSASIELTTAVMLKKFFNLKFNAQKLALICQAAENKFVGVNCGIMDQFAIANGKKDNALFLDCATLKFDYVPVKLEGVSVLIANTNKRRELADSKYNERRAECDGALNILQKKFAIKNLCRLKEEQLPDAEKLLNNPLIFKRVRHAVTEEARTVKAARLLKAGDIEAFAKLLDASHASLRDDYEVTGRELDAIVAVLQAQKGVLGARMMGAGFGGCAIALTEDDHIETVRAAAEKAYFDKTGLKADFYVAAVGPAAGEE